LVLLAIVAAETGPVPPTVVAFEVVEAGLAVDALIVDAGAVTVSLLAGCIAVRVAGF
jgi:hypothetical protein